MRTNTWHVARPRFRAIRSSGDDMERELDREHELNASVVSSVALSDRVSIKRVWPDARSVPDFVPGQFVQLGLPVAGGGFEKRAYSVASSPDDKEGFEFLIARV